MFDYGNSLGNAWILKTHYIQMQKELEGQIKMFAPGKASFMNRLKKADTTDNAIYNWVQEKKNPAISVQTLRKLMNDIWIPSSLCIRRTAK